MEYLQDKYIKSIKYEGRLKPKYISGYNKQIQTKFSKETKTGDKKNNKTHMLLIKDTFKTHGTERMKGKGWKKTYLTQTN